MIRQQQYVGGSAAAKIQPTMWSAGIYCRLSVDDATTQESGSIQTQKAMLTEWCGANGVHISDVYIDDGVSGTSFDRPEFQRMIADIEAGKINMVVTKDLSRFGRNYAEAGMYLDHYFVEHDVRFVATQDNVDTLKKGFDISVPMRNIINDMYAREVSQKTRAAKETRARQGLFMGSKAPYGYAKSSENKNRLVIDEDAAEVVRYIFEMAANGAGYNKIARALRAAEVPNPATYYKQRHPEYDVGGHFKEQCMWHVTSVQTILQNEVYIGNLVQCRRGTKGIKGRRIMRDASEWVVAENTHEAIVDEYTWDIVQSQLAVKRRPCKNGEMQMFAGLLYCSDCGSALSFSTLKRKTMPDGGQYKCWRYMRHGKETCSAHYINLDQITELVLADIRHHARFAVNFRQDYLVFLRQIAESSSREDLEIGAKDCDKAQQRIAALDEIIKKLLEKNATGAISDDRFYTLSAEYETEQAMLKAQVAEFEQQMNAEQECEENAEQFVGLIDKYLDLQSLDARILNELIDRIIVHEKTMIDGVRHQEVEIYYKFIGLANIYV